MLDLVTPELVNGLRAFVARYSLFIAFRASTFAGLIFFTQLPNI